MMLLCMAINSTVIKAYIRLYTTEQLTALLTTALGNLSSGVVITGMSYEGGSSSATVAVDTVTLIEMLETALQEKEASEAGTVQTRQCFYTANFVNYN